ncbi:DUF2621 family protein [Oceanobacillus locisalsi]|uniref:DUF2621 family protein n=1 Tax=Oceanobacillus locisalsi TaxID=546107 RepID=A0ABW3NET4_9BACI
MISLIIILWGCLLIGLMAIGGYFMFRKFLKKLPKEDGRSIMDWEEHYLEQTIHKWSQTEKDFLEELVSPVPELFRDVARQRIASKIGELSIQKNEATITHATLIEGYILATPKKDHKFLRKKLKEKNIDVTPYESFFKQSKEDYQENWREKYKQKNS